MISCQRRRSNAALLALFWLTVAIPILAVKVDAFSTSSSSWSRSTRNCFSSRSKSRTGMAPSLHVQRSQINTRHTHRSNHLLQMANNNAVEEEARLRVLGDRRRTIRGALKTAESVRNFRINTGYVPELNEEGNPIKSDSKAAVTLTAFVVAGGAVALRVGGRAALVSGLGLDFVTENPDLKNQLENVLTMADAFDPIAKAALFVGAWTLVKVSCFDAGGVALALSAGILFGGVLQGAVFSAFAATVGSSVAFALAKADTPIRKKALELLEEYPSLRGIEKVVARDGLKAILTLRLAPIIPIPIGFYNYVYGVTNVPYFDFAGGIFLGSIKPYLLDSYLGYFGKTVIDGSAAADPSGMQDILLLVALGVSVLIGVFASQLAGETWDTVLQEVEAEKKAKQLEDGVEVEEKDGIVREVFGLQLPVALVGFQLSLADSNDRIGDFIEAEFDAQVWNYTKAEGGPPREVNPALAPDSPEVAEVGKGFDFGKSICDGIVLSPCLFSAVLKYADPLFNEVMEMEERKNRPPKKDWSLVAVTPVAATSGVDLEDKGLGTASILSKDAELLYKLADLRTRTRQRFEKLEDKLNVD